jgi:hypothetical protein
VARLVECIGAPRACVTLLATCRPVVGPALCYALLLLLPPQSLPLCSLFPFSSCFRLLHPNSCLNASRAAICSRATSNEVIRLTTLRFMVQYYHQSVYVRNHLAESASATPERVICRSGAHVRRAPSDRQPNTMRGPGFGSAGAFIAKERVARSSASPSGWISPA